MSIKHKEMSIKELREVIDLACSLPNMPKSSRQALAVSTYKKITKRVTKE